MHSLSQHGMTPLMYAACMGDVHAADLILSKPAVNIHAVDERGCTALHWAASTGAPHIALKVLDRAEESLLDAVNGRCETALYIAAREGNDNVVQVLLERGARTGKCDPHPLYLLPGP